MFEIIAGEIFITFVYITVLYLKRQNRLGDIDAQESESTRIQISLHPQQWERCRTCSHWRKMFDNKKAYQCTHCGEKK